MSIKRAMMGVMTTSSPERHSPGTFRVVAAAGAFMPGMSVRPMVGFFGGENGMPGFQYTITIFAVLSV